MKEVEKKDWQAEQPVQEGLRLLGKMIAKEIYEKLMAKKCNEPSEHMEKENI